MDYPCFVLLELSILAFVLSTKLCLLIAAILGVKFYVTTPHQMLAVFVLFFLICASPNLANTVTRVTQAPMGISVDSDKIHKMPHRWNPKT